ncbi:MAG: heme-degrading domain-containing protein [Actinomycetes bacterium]
MTIVDLLGTADGLDLSDRAQIERDLEILRQQHRALVFSRFDTEVALALGLYVRELSAERGLSVAVDIHGFGGQLFFSRMEGTSPNNENWLRRKRNVVRMYQRSSYEVGRDFALDGTSFEILEGLPLSDYAAVGGCVPIQVQGAGIVGDIGVSGLPDRDDHNLAVEALIAFLD